MSFADNLKMIRKERNITQEQLAELFKRIQTGCIKMGIWKWISGNRKTAHYFKRTEYFTGLSPFRQ